ncbi:MAG: hypothetical protein KDE48_15095, partial [Anaerolineales bacterium]|nr:hypothetical protein [Anaerolineales bacterium]
CLGDKTGPACCFVKPHPGITRLKKCEEPADDQKWERRPVEPQTILVRGSVKFEDGTPLSDAEFILTAPDGEFLNSKKPGAGEQASGSDRGRPIPDRTDAAGKFSYPLPTPVGVYSIEFPKLADPQVVRAADAPPASAKGKIVCKRLEPKNNPDEPVDFDIIVMPAPAPIGVAELQFVTPNDVDILVDSVAEGDSVRLRADLPGLDAGVTEIIVEISSHGTPPGPGPGPGPNTAVLEFVESGNVDITVDNLAVGNQVRLRADLPNVSSDEIVVEISSHGN